MKKEMVLSEEMIEKFKNGVRGKSYQAKDLFNHMYNNKVLFDGDDMVVPFSQNMKDMLLNDCLGYSESYKDVDGNVKQILSTDDIITVKWNYKIEDIETEYKKKYNDINKKKGKLPNEEAKKNRLTKEVNKLNEEIDVKGKEVKALYDKYKDRPETNYKLRTDKLRNEIAKAKDILERKEKQLKESKKNIEILENKSAYYKNEIETISKMTEEEKEEYTKNFTSSTKEEIRNTLNEDGITIKKTVYEKDLEKAIEKKRVEMKVKKGYETKAFKEEVEKLVNSEKYSGKSHIVEIHYKDVSPSPSKQRQDKSTFKKESVKVDGKDFKGKKTINGYTINGKSITNNKEVSDPFDVLEGAEELAEKFNKTLKETGITREQADILLEQLDNKKIAIEDLTVNEAKVVNAYKKAMFPLVEYDATNSLAESAIVDGMFTNKIKSSEILVLKDIEVFVEQDVMLLEKELDDNLRKVAKETASFKTIKELTDGEYSDDLIGQLTGKKLKKVKDLELTYENAISRKTIANAVDKIKNKDFVAKREAGELTLDDLRNNKTINSLIEKSFNKEKIEEKLKKQADNIEYNEELKKLAKERFEDLKYKVNNIDKISIEEVKSISKEIRQAVADETVKCEIKRNYKKASNVMFDGMGLIDKSCVPYEDANFIFTRHDAWKSGLTKMDLQQYFKDKLGDKYKSAKIKDMFGNEHYVKDIKVVTTDNSFKILKYKDSPKYREYGKNAENVLYQKWCENFDKKGGQFAVTGIEHESKYGKYAKNNYQVMASVDFQNKIDDVIDEIKYPENATPKQIAEINMKAFIKEQTELINGYKDDDAKFIGWLREYAKQDEKANMYLDMIDHNAEILNTPEFRNWKSKKISKMVEEMRTGRILTEGKNQVLIGDVQALANCVVYGRDEVERSINSGEDIYTMFKNETKGKNRQRVFTKGFGKGDKIAMARNPQIGNFSIVSAENVFDESYEICNYIELGDDMLLVDNTEYLLQATLSGQDLDYDHCLSMKNKTLDALINKQYNDKNVLVPVDKTGNKKMKYVFSAEDKTKKGILIGTNRVGQNSNLAQLLQAQREHLIYNNTNGEFDKQIEELTKLIHRANALQNHEIDGAKRVSNINTSDEMGSIQRNKSILRYSEDEAELMNKELAKKKFVKENKGILSAEELEDIINKKAYDEVKTVTTNTPKRPLAFDNIKKGNKTVTTKLDCNLDMLNEKIKDSINTAKYGKADKDLFTIVKKLETKVTSNESKRVTKVINAIDEYDKQIKHILSGLSGATKEEMKEGYEIITMYSNWISERIDKIAKSGLTQEEYLQLVNKAVGKNSTLQGSIFKVLYKNDKEKFINCFVEGTKLPSPKVFIEVMTDNILGEFNYTDKVVFNLNEHIDAFCSIIDKDINSLFYNNIREMSIQEQEKYLNSKLTKEEMAKLRGKWGISFAKLSRIDAINKDIELTTTKLADVEKQLMKNLYTYNIKKGYSKTLDSINKICNMDIKLNELTEEQIEKILAKKTFDRTYIDSVLGHKKVLDKFIEKDLKDNLLNKGDWSMKQYLMEIFENHKYAENRLLMSETTIHYNKGVMECYKALGIDSYVFVSVHEHNTCTTCNGLSGQVFGINEALVGTNYPLIHANCKCTTYPYLDLEMLRGINK